MSILEKLNAVKDTVANYWPIGEFVYQNPLRGFEHLHFKEGLTQAQSLYGGNVYMEPSYYINLKEEGKISLDALEKNLQRLLDENDYASYLEEAKTFMLEISPQWDGLRSYEALKTYDIDDALHSHLEQASIYWDKYAWVKKLTKQMTLYEVHDALFGSSDKELIEKDVIEFLARFLDKAQTTLSMEDRDRGMFGAFKLYEDINHDGDAQSYVEKLLEKLKV
ncbi:MAG TPA: DUF2309 family protein [Epsilonproteobacteria bacterium]|nr:DUF2309 family protein [Campylobacterota bacterium]